MPSPGKIVIFGEGYSGVVKTQKCQVLAKFQLFFLGGGGGGSDPRTAGGG